MTVAELKEHIDEKFNDLKSSMTEDKRTNREEHDEIFNRLRAAETKIAIVMFAGSAAVALISLAIGIIKLWKG